MSDCCLFCQERLPRDLEWHHLFTLGPIRFPVLCKECQALFQPLAASELVCDHCLRPLEKDASNPFILPYRHKEDGVDYCYDCFKWREQLPINYLRHDVLLEYNEAVREWLYTYKYQGDVRQSKVVADRLAKVYRQYQVYTWTVLPSSPNHLKERLFHPTALLLEEASVPYGFYFDYIGDGKRQAAKTKKQRLELKQPFELRKNSSLPEKLLIFDDLYTTGTTMMKAKECVFNHDPTIDLISLSLARDSLQETLK
ncbi:ComF family protein [Dolosicoccus paucivorans]|uniref:ComF family protein n=1 Tax=Dolosicoccus paucivorans TaxID=84521 RepID=UPI000890DF91|nr:ComF family protein [Dolosicoccus paucivorans]SDI57352.1 competence protein ComFC [Dolosicoccus paucivorans]